MNDVVLIAESETAEAIQMDLIDNTISLPYLKSQFGPDVSGLQFRNPTTKRWRGVVVEADRLIQPRDGWLDRTCILRRIQMSNGKTAQKVTPR